MKINLIDSTTHQPYANRAVLIQVKDKETGQVISTLTLRSTQEGALTLDQKYEGKLVAAFVNGMESKWIRAMENAKIDINSTANLKTTTTDTTSPNTQKQQKQQDKTKSKSGSTSASNANFTNAKQSTPEKSKS